MAKKKIKVKGEKEEVKREVIDNDHILITYKDGTTETRLV